MKPPVFLFCRCTSSSLGRRYHGRLGISAQTILDAGQFSFEECVWQEPVNSARSIRPSKIQRNKCGGCHDKTGRTTTLVPNRYRSCRRKAVPGRRQNYGTLQEPSEEPKVDD